MRIILEGTVLSPIHISTLTERSLKRRLEKYENIINVMKKLIGNDPNLNKYDLKIKEKLMKLKKFASNENEFIKDRQGNPYIPGSSLKGSFASSIEHYKKWKLDDIERKNAFQNFGFRDAYISKNNIIKVDIIISNELVIKNVEVLKPYTTFNIEMIYRENPYLKIEEIFVYPMLKTLKVIDIIIKKNKTDFLPQEIVEYYKRYTEKFGNNFNADKIENKFNFIKEHGLVIRLGKYTGKLLKITLESFDREYQNLLYGNTIRYIGRISAMNNIEVLCGFLKLKILSYNS